MLISSRRPRGTAIFFAIILLVVLATITIGLIQALLPRNRDISGIERSNQAFYEAETAVELALLAMNKTDPAMEPSVSSGSSTAFRQYSAQSRAVSTLYPTPWTGNSPFDQDWARMSVGTPITLYIPPDRVNFLTNLRLVLRVPNLDGSGSTSEALSGASTLEILQWTMTAPNSVGGAVEAIGGASWSRITIGQIRTSTELSGKEQSFYAASSRRWHPNSDVTVPSIDIPSFIGNKTCAGINCTLKISIIRPLLLTNGELAPFLEYQVSGTGIINPSTIITAQGVTGGYRRAVSRESVHQSTLEILDYATAQ